MHAAQVSKYENNEKVKQIDIKKPEYYYSGFSFLRG
jgi:hypothetical protein